MPLIRSLLYSLRQARLNPFVILHSLLYAATVSYLRVLKNIAKIPLQALRDHIGATYHGKVVVLDDAKKIITINEDIELRNLDQVIPCRHAKDLILKNPHNISVYECPCRWQKKEHCEPTEVCLVIGEPFADLLRLFQPFRSRRITPEEALRIIDEEDARGHVHTAWFKSAMLDRFFAICNCCSCCCLGMKLMSERRIKMLLPSGYRAVIGDTCVGCGICAGYCQFDAIAMSSVHDNGTVKKNCAVVSEKCFGCGVCESKCSLKAISLVLDPAKGVPLDIEMLTRPGKGPEASHDSPAATA